MPLELAVPSALWLFGLLPLLVLLYVLKVKRQRLRVGSTWLWAQARRDLMARSPFRRLVWQLPLLLQAFALILLALAAAGPATPSLVQSGDHLAIVIDTSASMAARDASTGKRRIELAKEAALAIVERLAPGSDAMIIEAARDAHIALPRDRDTRRMRRAIEALAAREVEGDLGQALALAVGHLGPQAGDRRLVVITDGALARPAALSQVSVALEVVRVGSPADNAAIVRVDVRVSDDPVSDREQVQAFLLVANFGERPRDVYVTMRQRNASDTLASRKVLLPAGEKVPVVLSFHPAAGDYGSGLVFELSPHDALEVDDRAYGRVPAGRRLPVVLASAAGRSPFLLRALAADPDAEVRAGSVAEMLDSASVEHDALVVIDGACPAAPPGGDLLIVHPPPGPCFGVTVGKSVDEPRITSWHPSDARMRFLTFDNVALSKANLLEVESASQALLTAAEGVLAADVSTGSRRATLLGFDVGDGNWPYRWSFVVFVRNLLEQARAHRRTGTAGPYLTGVPLRASVPVAAGEAWVEGPELPETRLPVQEGLMILPEVPLAGLYRVRWESPRPGALWLPVNLTSADESDLRREPDATSAAVLDPAAPREIPAHRSWAWVLALAALGLVLLDVWWLTRRRLKETAS